MGLPLLGDSFQPETGYPGLRCFWGGVIGKMVRAAMGGVVRGNDDG